MLLEEVPKPLRFDASTYKSRFEVIIAPLDDELVVELPELDDAPDDDPLEEELLDVDELPELDDAPDDDPPLDVA